LLSINGKGLRLQQLLKELFAFLWMGQMYQFWVFDDKKKDEGYAALLENTIGKMASSHQIKRFLQRFLLSLIWFLIWYCTSYLSGGYRFLCQRLFYRA